MKNMPAEGKILYMGSDFELSFEMHKFFHERSQNIICEDVPYTPGILMSFCSLQNIDIIFFDFSEPGIEIAELLQETLTLKRVSQFKSVLFVAIFKNELQKHENNVIFTSGFQLSFIKGSETEAIFRDSYYIGLRKKVEFPILALARNIKLPLEIGICSTITGMGKDGFRIETDIEGLKDRIKLNLPMFPGLKCKGYEIKESGPPSFQYPMTTSYFVAYPLSGPWVDDSEENIQQDTVDTWLDSFESDFVKSTKIFVRIYSNDLFIVDDIFREKDPSIQINFGNDTKNLEIEIFQAKPSLIFINLDNEDAEDKLSLKILDFLLSISFSLEYKPIIVVTNCNSTGTALQKAYNYPLIVATQGRLDAGLCLTMIRKFKSRQVASSHEAIRDFKIASEYRSLNVFEDFTLTSLTEHEVTFFSEIELPMFTVLHFNLPMDFHATIVPSILSLEKKNDLYHYMAFIHGLSEEQLMVLRKFLNQIIYSPLKDFSEESVRKAMGEALTHEEPKLISPSVPVDKNDKTITNKPAESKKYNFNGKSKL